MATNARNGRKKATEVKKYIDYLTETPEQREDEFLQRRQKQAHINHQQAVLNAEGKVHEAENEVDIAIRTNPYEPLTVVKMRNKLELAQRELKQLQELQKELF